jgi:hypothetical protein
MGGEITRAPSPLAFGIGEGIAVHSGREGEGLGATLAGLNDSMACATIVAAAVLTHEEALFSLLDCLTEHGLFLLYPAVRIRDSDPVSWCRKKAGASMVRKLPSLNLFLYSKNRKIQNSFCAELMPINSIYPK